MRFFSLVFSFYLNYKMHRTIYKQQKRTSFSRSRGGRFSRSRGRGRKVQKIDVSKFIRKAEVPKEVAPFVPKHSFKDFDVDTTLKENILARGFDKPTPIQDEAIIPILEGRDVVGIANTGTGKTAAFLIPLVDKVLKNPEENVIIITPTRELAQQISDDLWSFAKRTSIFSVCAVGGVPMSRQLAGLKRGCNFIIGTPGRIKDLVERDHIDLSRFNSVVLDEADRMLDMGFIDDMRFLLSKMPSERHTLFFSATLSREIEKLIGEFLNDPVTISVKTGDTSKNVDQDIVRVEGGKSKFEVLSDLLGEMDFDKVLVFGRTKHGVEQLSRDLSREGIGSRSIHGDKSQRDRERALNLFKKGDIQVLVATDVAARGLDIPNVTHVINYDIPATDEDYIHRIGRTGRGDQKGKALTFID